MQASRPPEPWKSFFADVDAALSNAIELHCIGGFALTTLYGLERPTADLDILPVGPRSATQQLTQLAGQGSALHKQHKIYLQVVGVATVPINYQERMIELYTGSFEHLRLFSLDPYDLALSKIERNTQRDRDDVKHLGHTVAFDLSVLRNRYETELRPHLGNPEREDLTLKLWIEMLEEERHQPRPFREIGA